MSTIHPYVKQQSTIIPKYIFQTNNTGINYADDTESDGGSEGERKRGDRLIRDDEKHTEPMRDTEKYTDE